MKTFRAPEVLLGRGVPIALGGFLFMLFAGPMMAADTNTTVGWVEQEFGQAASRFQANTNDAEAAWQLGRACFDMANLQNQTAREADFAQQGIVASRIAVRLSTNSAAAHYYLGMNIGELADTKRNLAALRMVKDMEREFLTARTLDEKFDEAGPDRNLGILYRDAPVFASVGSRTKARQHLERAVELAPVYPDNQLSLIEGYMKWDYHNEALRQFHELEKLWPDAQKKFSGPARGLDWVDWNKRFNSIKKKLEPVVKVNETPHSAGD